MFNEGDLHLIAEVFDRYTRFRVFMSNEGANTPADQLAALAIVGQKAKEMIRSIQALAKQDAKPQEIFPEKTNGQS